MEEWRQCGRWLIDCKVLPPNHRVVCGSAEVFDLARVLRDGVLLCQLMHHLSPGSVDLKKINFRPQMSQFLCLNNIRTFLKVCHDKFGLRNSEMFDPFHLFDVTDFGKVISVLSRISHHSIAQIKGIRPFPSEDTALTEGDVYQSLQELADEHEVGQDDIYDCVCDDEENNIYEVIIKVLQPMKTGVTEEDKRSFRLLEIQETEVKYCRTLEDIEKNFMIPLKQVLTAQEMKTVFVNLEDISKVHLALLRAIDLSMMSGGHSLGKIFLDFKERLLVYGQYCSQVENARRTLDEMTATREDLRCKVQECTMRVQGGKFKLQDLLVVPVQRVLKYHLLLKDLVKYSMDRPESQQLTEALESMQDLAMYINEVKRDNETLKKIRDFQSSIDNLQVELENYGRPKMDGELKVTSIEHRTKQDRYIFLFDKAVIVCKRKLYNYELKEIIDLHLFKVSDDLVKNRDMKKWSYSFYLIHLQGKQGFQIFCKTEDTKFRWMEQFQMAISNIKPEGAAANRHNFQMHTFKKHINCRACKMLLRGLFYQGYCCSGCGAGAHKECLEIMNICSAHESELGLPQSGPKMVAIRSYDGTPAPPGKKMPLSFQTGELIELLKGDPDSSWWEGKLILNQKTGFFPSSSVKPCLDPKPVSSRQSSREMDYHANPWFAGNMERQEADNLLKSHSSGTFLVRERAAESERFAISVTFNDEVKHIRVMEKNNCFYLTEAKKFESLLELVEYYQSHSFKEIFKPLDTTLQHPYKPQQHSHANTRSPGLTPGVVCTAVARYNFVARDIRELSLRRGASVKIHSRVGGDQGWWKGEINGRIGWFPSAYVDDEGGQ